MPLLDHWFLSEYVLLLHQVLMFTLPSFSLLCSHNDLPWNIRKFVHNELETVNFTHNLKYVEPWSKSPWSHTDIMRLADGMVGCQVSERDRQGLRCTQASRAEGLPDSTSCMYRDSLNSALQVW